MLACASYLKLFEKLRHARGEGRRRSKSRRRINITISQAVRDLHANLQERRRSAEEMQKVRESILHCVAVAVSDLLGHQEDDVVVANLLDFSTGTLDDMRVAARSTRAREYPKQYPAKDLVAFKAIQSGSHVS